MDSPQPPQLNLTPSMGITLIGCIFSASLYGVTCIQTFHYYRSPNRDPWHIKFIVLLLLILDTVHQALISFMVYHYLILNFANPLELLHNIWAIGAEIIVNAAIAFIVECFLVIRIWLLSSHNVFVTGACGLMTVGHLVMNLVFPIKTLQYSNIQTGSQALQPIGTAGLGVAVVTDVCISFALCFYLQKGRGNFQRTNNMITKLIALTITTGLLTTIFVIANLIALVVAPSDLFSIFFNFQLAKLYINALLTSLNARGTIRAGNDRKGGREPVSNFTELSHAEFALHSIEPSVTLGSGHGSRGVIVHVSKDSDIEHDAQNGYKTNAN